MSDKNPWTAEHWNVTAQGQIFKKFGEAKARELAEAAGSQVDAAHPPVPKVRVEASDLKELREELRAEIAEIKSLLKPHEPVETS
jgi:hypothetical protein